MVRYMADTLVDEMKNFKERVLERELLGGTWCSLGSNITAEIAGRAGFDWILVDLEHGSGTLGGFLSQLQGIGCTDSEPIVRIAMNETPRFKRVLDMGAKGVMVPYVSSADEAQQAVRSMRYPPKGIRGVASLNRATRYGGDFERYFTEAEDDLLLIVQIETREAVDNAEAIANVDGVDVLFIGPLDLTTSLGIRGELHRPEFISAMEKVANASKNAGKAAGTLLLNPDDVAKAIDIGFSFIAVGSDAGCVVSGMKNNAELLQRLKKQG